MLKNPGIFPGFFYGGFLADGYGGMVDKKGYLFGPCGHYFSKGEGMNYLKNCLFILFGSLLHGAHVPMEIPVGPALVKEKDVMTEIEKHQKEFEDLMWDLSGSLAVRDEKICAYAKAHKDIVNQDNLSRVLGSALEKTALYFIEQGVNIDSDTIRMAMRMGSIKIFQILLEKALSNKLPDTVQRAFLDLMEVILPLDMTEKDPEMLQLRKNARAAWMEMLKILVDKGADVNGKRSNHFTPLMSAATRGDFEVVEFLVSKGADVNLVGPNGQTALSNAARGGNLQILEFLASKGAVVNPPDRKPFLNALMTGKLDLIKFFVERGVDVKTPFVINDRDADEGEVKRTIYPLDMALNYNPRVETVAYLLEKGADPNKAYIAESSKGREEHSPFETLVYGGLEEGALLLVAKGVKFSPEQKVQFIPHDKWAKEKEICVISYALMPRLLEEAVKQNISLLAKGEKNKTLLHFACLAKVNPADFFRFDRVDVQADLKKTIEILLKNGVDLNVQDDDGNTALHDGIKDQRFPKSINIILDFNPKVTIKNKAGKTAIDLAREEKAQRGDSEQEWSQIILRMEEMAKKEK